MKLFTKYLSVFFLLCIGTTLQAQNNNFNTVEKFTVRGSVAEKDTRNPIKNANVEVNGGSYTTTDVFGEFKIEVKKGDELIIKHQDFETVYYTIQDNERIMVLVESTSVEDSRRNVASKSRNTQVFKSLVDSAETYLKKDAKKSLQFITDALAKSSSAKENAEVYDVIGDIYMYWKQYDLAVSNYRISIQNIPSNETKLKLAKAFQFNKNYQESIQTYNSISKKDLSKWQLVSLNEGLGDVNLLTKNYKASIDFYKEGLKVAEANKISAKITDLNSKIGEAYSASGNNEAAKDYFGRSLKLANTENKKRAAEEKVKVADFQNNISNYSSEIQLRKEALKDIEKVSEKKENIIDNESALTQQKQNYKIGSAYALQGDYQNAIPFLEKSIAEADKKEDLIVQKDATRRLSDVYRDAGDFEKALSVYQEYVDLVDKVYIKKEQEISQSARFSKELAAKQNRIVSLESDRELSESKYQLTIEQSKRQQLVIYSLIGGVLLLLFTAYFMFKYIKQQRLANNLLALKTLRSQMNPHFIFNALNSVNSFIASNDERTANKYLSDFSLLMRAVLENSEEDFIPLKKEIELLELYTKLEHFRFKDKFDYTIDVDKNITIEDFVIPPMLLQPYIENAVWHGLRYKKDKGHLSISIAQTQHDEITITIADDGIGREQSKALKTENQQKQNSKGMGNIKKRVSILNAMYKDKVDVFIEDFQDDQDTGTKVMVTLKKD
ncbi:MAG: sensor histidine kinase [Flavobacteriales bacterium 32-35-8]|nr:MAG: sensor histidine kinase [Flavobacteriales bacterium 32-35-8]